MSTDATDKYERKFSDFLIERIQRMGGSIKFQNLSGHLSQFNSDIRSRVGVLTLPDLKNFLRVHPNLFKIQNDNVTLVEFSENNYDNDIIKKSSLPHKILKGKGVIIKLMPGFGFLNAKDPIKTTVFFTAKDFGDRNIDLTDFGLNIGTTVCFNAIKETTDEFRSKYKATKVWKVGGTDKNVDPIVPKRRKNRETGLYDPINISGEGTIQNCFPNLGFIAVDGDDKNTVFFHKNRVVNYDNIVDLTKVFQKGERVEFKAHRTTKPDTKARWEAIQVWKKSGKMSSSHNSVKHESSNQKGESYTQSSRSEVSHKMHSAVNRKLNTVPKEIIKNQRGKIHPRAHGAVIKFGEKYSQLADGDSSTYYTGKSKVDDISWVFSEGDDVLFDAIKIKSAPGWKAILVWTDEKPDIDLPMGFGDFPENTDEELDEIPEASSYTSKSSYLSENSYASIQSDNTKSAQMHTVKTNAKNKLNSLEFSEVPSKFSSKSSIGSETCNSLSSSQYSLCSSTESKQLAELRKKFEEDIEFDSKSDAEEISYINWGDSPYPDDDEYVASKDMSDVAKESLDNKMMKDDDDHEMELFEEYLKNSVEENELPKKSTENQSINLLNSREKETASDADLKCKENVPKKSSIKKFQNVSGKVIKVYSKFAEVKICNIEKPLAFFWNTLYYNGDSVDDLQLSDLKEIIKVGDDINFNYFEIVDDSDQLWQKVTVVWRGIKPMRYTEITPREFIKQNQLSVTVNDESNSEDLPVKGYTKKFLTVVSDGSSDCDIQNSPSMTGDVEKCYSVSEDIEKPFVIRKNSEVSALSARDFEESMSVTESCFENEPFSDDQHKENAHSREVTELDTLTDLISHLLSNKQLFVDDSKVNLRMLSSELANLVLRYHDAEESDRSLPVFLSKENKQFDSICSICGNCGTDKQLSQSVVTQSSETQTVITGDIIAQNIFTEC